MGWTIGAAVVVGIATGLAQAVWLAVQLHGLGRMVWQSRDYLWMMPLAHAAILLATGIVGFGFALLVRAVRLPLGGRGLVAGILLFVSAFSLLLLAPRLHPAAQALIALGIAIRASPRLAGIPARRFRSGAIGLAALVLGLGVGERLWRRVAEALALAALPAAREGSPNVLLVILDTVRAASLSLYGYGRPTTPALERWAAKGVTFEYAISTAPWTLPSHAGMFTGRDAGELPTDWRTPLDRKYPTLAEALRAGGYATAGFVANTYYTGHDSGLERGFIHYDDYRTTLKQIYWSSTITQTELMKSLFWSRSLGDLKRALTHFDLSIPPLRQAHRKPAPLITDGFLNWQAHQQGRPFFAFLNYFDAHEPYHPPASHRRIFATKPTQGDLYDAAVKHLDDEIDRLFAELDRRGALERTIVVVTSDHGEYLGERGMWGHGKGMHLEVLRVPLLIRYPAAIPAGQRVEHAVSLRDLPTTLLELTGRSDPGFGGQSLSRFWRAQPEGRPVSRAGETLVRASTVSFEDAWVEKSRQRILHSILTDQLHWIATPAGEELYAYRVDPAERQDLADDPAWRARLDSLRAAIEPTAASLALDPEVTPPESPEQGRSPPPAAREASRPPTRRAAREP